MSNSFYTAHREKIAEMKAAVAARRPFGLAEPGTLFCPPAPAEKISVRVVLGQQSFNVEGHMIPEHWEHNQYHAPDVPVESDLPAPAERTWQVNDACLVVGGCTDKVRRVERVMEGRPYFRPYFNGPLSFERLRGARVGHFERRWFLLGWWKFIQVTEDAK